jgi:dolichyl-phosphate-mannose-protein mannosyltransferase
MMRGIAYWGAGSSHIYMLGNPVIWGLCFAGLNLYFIYQLRVMILVQRGYSHLYSSIFLLTIQDTQMNALNNAWFLGMGWALHYLPYFLMSRSVKFTTNI